MGKAAIWTISCFYSLPPLNYVEKQGAKLASSYAMGSQHCIEGEGGFLNRLFKIPWYFITDCLEFTKKKLERLVSMDAVSNNPNLL